jgi:hypothetical protein
MRIHDSISCNVNVKAICYKLSAVGITFKGNLYNNAVVSRTDFRCFVKNFDLLHTATLRSLIVDIIFSRSECKV